MHATPQEVREEIKRLAGTGIGPKEIADKLNVSYSVVYKYGGVKSNAERFVGWVSGRLTIIARAPGGLAICRCECGNEIIIPLGALKHPKHPQKSCGCLARDLADAAREDLTGKTVMGFKVVRFVRPGNNRKGNGPVWLLRCRAGHEFEAAKKKMKRGEVVCRECISDKRSAADRERRAARIRRTLEIEQRRAVRALGALLRQRLRELQCEWKSQERSRTEWERRHDVCGGEHILGKGRVVSCSEYENERRRQSLLQGGTGTPRDRNARKRDFDFSPTTKKLIFSRDGDRCLRCGRARNELDEGERLEADHVRAGVGNTIYDGQTLCTRCHSWKHKSRSRDGLCFLTSRDPSRIIQ